MAKFFDALPDEAIVATLSQQLSWSHFVELIKLDDPTQRTFYTDLCIQSRWSVRILRERIDGMLSARPVLGCPKPTRNQYKADGSWQTYTREFLKYIQTQSASLRELVKIAQATVMHLTAKTALPDLGFQQAA